MKFKFSTFHIGTNVFLEIVGGGWCMVTNEESSIDLAGAFVSGAVLL